MQRLNHVSCLVDSSGDDAIDFQQEQQLHQENQECSSGDKSIDLQPSLATAATAALDSSSITVPSAFKPVSAIIDSSSATMSSCVKPVVDVDDLSSFKPVSAVVYSSSATMPSCDEETPAIHTMTDIARSTMPSHDSIQEETLHEEMPAIDTTMAKAFKLVGVSGNKSGADVAEDSNENENIEQGTFMAREKERTVDAVPPRTKARKSVTFDTSSIKRRCHSSTSDMKTKRGNTHSSHTIHHTFAPGVKVEIRWKDKTWYNATAVSCRYVTSYVHYDMTYEFKVHYEGNKGASPKWVPLNCLRLPKNDDDSNNENLQTKPIQTKHNNQDSHDSDSEPSDDFCYFCGYGGCK